MTNTLMKFAILSLCFVSIALFGIISFFLIHSSDLSNIVTIITTLIILTIELVCLSIHCFRSFKVDNFTNKFYAFKIIGPVLSLFSFIFLIIMKLCAIFPVHNENLLNLIILFILLSIVYLERKKRNKRLEKKEK